jgi:hypothetical protein
LLGLLLELAVTNRTRLTKTRHVADRATRRDLLDAATMRGRRYYVKSNMTRQIGEGEIDMLVQEKYVLSHPAAPRQPERSWRLRKGPRVLRLRTEQIQDRCVAVKNKQDPASVRHPLIIAPIGAQRQALFSERLRCSHQTPRWREVDSNFRFRTRGAMAWPSSVASWAFFSARNCSALRARSGLTPLPAAPGHALSLAAGSRRGKRTRGDAKSARRQWEPGAYTVLAGGGLLCCLSASELDA